MSRLKSFCEKHFYFIAIFSFIILYNFIFVYLDGSWKFHEEAYMFHLVDYSMGFCSRFLLGAIYNFLFKNKSVQVVTIYNVILFMTFMFIIAVLLEKLILKIEKKNRETILFILMFFLTGTSTLAMYTYMLGSFDSWWFYLAILFIIFLSHKQLYVLIIPVFVLTVLVHYASIVAFIPFFILLLLYKISVVANKKDKLILWIVVTVSATLAVLLTFYFVVFDHENLTYSMDEFVAIIKSRGATKDPLYFLTSLYDYDYYGMFDSEYFENIDSPIKYAVAFLIYRIKVTISISHIEQAVVPFLLNLPIVLLIFSYCKKKIKENLDNKLKKFFFVCTCTMFFCTIVLGLFLSIDVVRFVSHAYMMLFSSFLYIIYSEKDASLDHIKSFICKAPRFIVVVYFIFYSSIIFKPYT